MNLYIVAYVIGNQLMVPYSKKVHKRLSGAKKELAKANENGANYEILYVEKWFKLRSDE